MTDRELLELAAKAAGLDFRWEAGFPGEMEEPTVFDEGFGDYWNPLVDDGDALRLAVKLGLEVDCEHDPICVGATRGEYFIGVREPCDSDPCSATRRAIVRAAAEMAKA